MQNENDGISDHESHVEHASAMMTQRVVVRTQHDNLD